MFCSTGRLEVKIKTGKLFRWAGGGGGASFFEDVPFVGVMYLTFTRLLRDNHRGLFGSLVVVSLVRATPVKQG